MILFYTILAIIILLLVLSGAIILMSHNPVNSKKEVGRVNWISVEMRLPKENGCYWVFTKEKQSSSISGYDMDEKKFGYFIDTPSQEDYCPDDSYFQEVWGTITHWADMEYPTNNPKQ